MTDVRIMEPGETGPHARVTISPQHIAARLTELAAGHSELDQYDVPAGTLRERIEALAASLNEANEAKRQVIDRTREILREFNHVEGEPLDDIAQVAVDAYHHARSGGGEPMSGERIVEATAPGSLVPEQVPQFGVRIARGIVTYWQDAPLLTWEQADEARRAIADYTGENGEVEKVTVVRS